MLSFGISSNALMVMVISTVQFTHVFLLSIQGKTTEVLWHVALTEIRAVLLGVVWEDCKSGGRPKELSGSRRDACYTFRSLHTGTKTKCCFFTGLFDLYSHSSLFLPCCPYCSDGYKPMRQKNQRAATVPQSSQLNLWEGSEKEETLMLISESSRHLHLSDFLILLLWFEIIWIFQPSCCAASP